MAANNLDSVSNGESQSIDPMPAEAEPMSYDFSFGAASPDAATYTNSRPVLEQPAVLPQPARTLTHPKPVSDPSTLLKAGAEAPRKRRHSHFQQDGVVIDGTSHYSSADKRRRLDQTGRLRSGSRDRKEHY